MIQDIFPSKLYNAFSNRSPAQDSFMISFCNDRIYAHYDVKNEKIIFPTFSDMTKQTEYVYLFSIDNNSFFLTLNCDETELSGFEAYSMRELRALRVHSNIEILAAYTSFHLWKWYSSSRFCGVCGSGTVHDTKERAMRCTKCGNVIYPRINPAVIVGVINDDKILITKYRSVYAHNALVAGFTEIGETLEQTVMREVMEETGVKVKNIRYYKSQPWGMASDLLVGFYCDVDGDDTIHMDSSELKYAEWVKREDVVLQPSDLSLTNEMMKMFMDGMI